MDEEPIFVVCENFAHADYWARFVGHVNPRRIHRLSTVADAQRLRGYRDVLLVVVSNPVQPHADFEIWHTLEQRGYRTWPG